MSCDCAHGHCDLHDGKACGPHEFRRNFDGALVPTLRVVEEVCLENLQVFTSEERQARRTFYLQSLVAAMLDRMPAREAEAVLNAVSGHQWEAV